MKNPTYSRGVYAPFDATAIPLSNRSFFFGDAVYDVIIGRNKKLYQFDKHMLRIRQNANAVGLKISENDEEILNIFSELCELTNACEFMLYIQYSGVSNKRVHTRPETAAELTMILTESFVSNKMTKISATSFSDMRYGYCNIKTTNLLPSVLSMNKAKDNSADIAFFVRDNKITEASSANIFLLKNGEFVTPTVNDGILKGITRDNLISFCNSENIKVNERSVYFDELFDADAVWITSTTRIMQLCTTLDEKRISKKAPDVLEVLFSKLYNDYLEKTE